MGYFHQTLILFESPQDRIRWLPPFQEALRRISVVPEETDIVVLNDMRNGKEKEPVVTAEYMLPEVALAHVMEWPGLGLLPYRHPYFNYEIGINYLTWNDREVDGMAVSFSGKDLKTPDRWQRQRALIEEIAHLTDYRYVVGDIGNAAEIHLDFEQSKSEIEAIIRQSTFEIDLRKNHAIT